jgi:N-acetylglucosamine-6-phosphate deacetylase
MDSLVIDCGRIVLPNETLSAMRLLIQGGRIVEIAAHLEPPEDVTIIDARDHIVMAGFIDIHVHGAVGADTMDASAESLTRMARFFAQHGVTGFLATTITARRAAIEKTLRFFETRSVSEGAQILGVHLEGPYLNPKRCGAQAVEHMRAANVEEYEPWLNSGVVKLITVAPEIEGGITLVQDAARRGIAVALGHTDATFVQAQRAFAIGANQATHTFNQMRELHHREPGTVGAVLVNDAVFAQIICDNVHVAPAVIDALYRCKGADKMCVITDAILASGLGDGHYEFDGRQVSVSGGEARLDNGALAGSTVTMNQCFRNVIAATNCSLVDASKMCSHTPACSIGLGDNKGKLAKGFDADLVVLDENFRVVYTIVGGTPIVP